MKVANISKTNFGKFYIRDYDYSSAQSQYISDINSKLNCKHGDSGTYSDQLEKLGYDIWATPAYKSDSIRLMLTKLNRANRSLYSMPVASIGEYTTNFNPDKTIKMAEDNNKVDKILAGVLLGIAGVMAILAVAKGCNEKSVVKNYSSAISHQIENVPQKTNSAFNIFKLK